MTGYEVRLIDSLRDLAFRGDDWDRLLAVTPQATFFQTREWLTTYWRHFGAGQLLRVLVVSQQQQPVGILPLAVYREPSRLGPLRVLGYPLADWGHTFGPVGPQPEATLREALHWISAQRRDWDLLDLRWATGTVDEVTARALRNAGFGATATATGETSWVDLRHGWDAYWSSRSAGLRSNVRRCERRLAGYGRVEAIHCRPTASDPRWDLFEQCQRVASRSWQASSTTGNTLSHPAVSDFLRDAHRAAAARQAVAINLLKLDGVAIAFHYDYVFRDAVLGLRAGYDSSLAAAGPGSVLLARSLRAACELGMRTVDLGATPAAYKARWRTSTSRIRRHCHYPPLAWRAQALRLKREFYDRVEAVTPV